MNKKNFDVVVENSYDKRGNEAVLIKIATSILELNVHLPLSLCSKIFSAEDSEQFYFVAGESANSSVHWKRESSEEVYILIGDDQDIWDICLIIPRETFADIVSEIRIIHPNP